MAKKKGQKNRLFSTSGQYGIKFNGQYGKLNQAERGKLLMEKGEIDKKLTKEERQAINAYIRYRKADIGTQLNKIPQTEAHKYMAIEVAEEFGINYPDTVLTDDMLNDMSSAMQQYAEQQQVYDTLAQDKRYINAVEETPQQYANVAKAMLEDDDKWRLLRKLAEVDKRLNYDRAYASETLKEIEDIIEQNKGVTFDYAFDMLAKNHEKSIRNAAEWEETLHPFADDVDVQTKALVSNKGFHGVDKAMSKYLKKAGFSTSLAAYSPAYFEIEV